MIQISATDITCPLSVTGLIPDWADQILQEPSAPADNTTTPEGKNLHLYTGPPCPFRFNNESPKKYIYYLKIYYIIFISKYGVEFT